MYFLKKVCKEESLKYFGKNQPFIKMFEIQHNVEGNYKGL